VGVSVTLPEASALVVSVFVEDPAVAVIVTDVAFAICQLSVTLCPKLMAVALAVSVTVGFAGGTALTLLQPIRFSKAMPATINAIHRKCVLLILKVWLRGSYLSATLQMPWAERVLLGKCQVSPGWPLLEPGQGCVPATAELHRTHTSVSGTLIDLKPYLRLRAQ